MYRDTGTVRATYTITSPTNVPVSPARESSTNNGTASTTPGNMYTATMIALPTDRPENRIRAVAYAPRMDTKIEASTVPTARMSELTKNPPSPYPPSAAERIAWV